METECHHAILHTLKHNVAFVYETVGTHYYVLAQSTHT